jgi:hypothetical protein
MAYCTSVVYYLWLVQTCRIYYYYYCLWVLVYRLATMLISFVYYVYLGTLGRDLKKKEEDALERAQVKILVYFVWYLKFLTWHWDYCGTDTALRIQSHILGRCYGH